MKAADLLSAARRASSILAKSASALQSPLLFVIRVCWGWQFFLTGKGKLMNLERTSEFFASLNIPLPTLNAALAGATECIGGLLLLIGFASRFTALPLIFTMCVAYATAEIDSLKAIFSEPDKFLAADPFLFLFAAVLVLVFGPGAWSLDWILARKTAIQPQSAAASLLSSQHRESS